MESIILKGTDGRVQPLSVKSLLKGARASAGNNVAEACRPTIELLKTGADVRGIEVRCTCGEVTVIELTYPKS